MSDSPDPNIAADIQNERRLEERHIVHWPILVSWTTPTGPAVMQGRTLDLSLSGVRISVEHNFALGDRPACRLSVQPWHGNNSVFDIDMIAKVVHCAYSAQNEGFDVGLAFQSFGGDGKAQLAKVVQALARGVSALGAKAKSAG